MKEMPGHPELNYEDDLRIDGHSLDLECLDQAARFMRYSRELADARDRLARAERHQDIVEAEANDRARKRLTDPDKKAPTVDAVKAAVAVDEAVKKAAAEILDLKHEVDVLQAAVSAFDHRKRMLENLVTLHGQQYFAGPRVPNDIGREFVRQGREQARGEARDHAAARTGRTR